MGVQVDEAVAVIGEPLARSVGDELFILTPSGAMHWLQNATACFLWEELVRAGARGLNARALARALAHNFSVSEGEALTDVQLFLQRLTQNALVGPVGSVESER